MPQRREFLQAVARLARAHGALLIFDEVISGFRLSFQGYAGVSGVHPDLTTYGKVIGGGFPVGADGGRPRADGAGGRGRLRFHQAGMPSPTRSATCAGLATLQRLTDGSVYRRLEELGARLGARAQLRAPGLAIQRARLGVLDLQFSGAATSGHTDTHAARPAGRCRPELPALFHPLLERGIYLAPSAYEVGFLSAAHTEAQVDTLAQALLALLPPIDRR